MTVSGSGPTGASRTSADGVVKATLYRSPFHATALAVPAAMFVRILPSAASALTLRRRMSALASKGISASCGVWVQPTMKSCPSVATSGCSLSSESLMAICSGSGSSTVIDAETRAARTFERKASPFSGIPPRPNISFQATR